MPHPLGSKVAAGLLGAYRVAFSTLFIKMALKALKVVEMAGLAPAPFCGMILAGIFFFFFFFFYLIW